MSSPRRIEIVFKDYCVKEDGDVDVLPHSLCYDTLIRMNYSPPRKMLRETLAKRYNKRNDKTLTFDEFKVLTEEFKPYLTTVEHIVTNFCAIDKDGSGRIDKHEFKEGLGAAAEPLTDREFQGMWDAIDVDHSGEITISEFVAAMIPSVTDEEVEEFLESLRGRSEAEQLPKAAEEDLRRMLEELRRKREEEEAERRKRAEEEARRKEEEEQKRRDEEARRQKEREDEIAKKQKEEEEQKKSRDRGLEEGKNAKVEPKKGGGCC